jgi:hypothetical protein
MRGGAPDLLPGKAGDPGRTATDNRIFVNAVLWCCARARAGAVRRHATGPATAAQALCPLGGQRCPERVFAALTADRDNEYLMIDSSIVPAHARRSRAKRAVKRRWGAREAD